MDSQAAHLVGEAWPVTIDSPLGPLDSRWQLVRAEQVSITRALTPVAPVAMLIADPTAAVLVQFSDAEQALAIGIALTAVAREHLGITPGALHAVAGTGEGT